MKTLKTIQNFSKLGKGLSKLVEICCMIGVIGCIIGAISMSLVGNSTIEIDGVTIHNIIETEAEPSIGTIYTTMLVGAILCLGEFFIAHTACAYFKNELKAGTPFTLEGSKELLHLGISAIWISILTNTVAQVAQGIMYQFLDDVEALSIDGFGSISLGITLIFVSLLCKYGAELSEKAEDAK